MNGNETTLSWQETEFYTHGDLDIIPLNGNETTVIWQETEFYTHVDLDIVPLNRKQWASGELNWYSGKYLLILSL
jgi:hypothetical protein